jgi:hypothetical protein
VHIAWRVFQQLPGLPRAHAPQDGRAHKADRGPGACIVIFQQKRILILDSRDAASQPFKKHRLRPHFLLLPSHLSPAIMCPPVEETPTNGTNGNANGANGDHPGYSAIKAPHNPHPHSKSPYQAVGDFLSNVSNFKIIESTLREGEQFAKWVPPCPLRACFANNLPVPTSTCPPRSRSPKLWMSLV